MAAFIGYQIELIFLILAAAAFATTAETGSRGRLAELPTIFKAGRMKAAVALDAEAIRRACER